MMQKERMFEQKFTQVGASGSTNFAANPTTSSSLIKPDASRAFAAGAALSGGAATGTGAYN